MIKILIGKFRGKNNIHIKMFESQIIDGIEIKNLKYHIITVKNPDSNPDDN